MIKLLSYIIKQKTNGLQAGHLLVNLKAKKKLRDQHVYTQTKEIK